MHSVGVDLSSIEDDVCSSGLNCIVDERALLYCQDSWRAPPRGLGWVVPIRQAPVDGYSAQPGSC